MYDRLTKSGGLTDHLGTADVTEIKKRIEQGDTYAKLIYDSMIYQAGKYIAAYSAVVRGSVDAILLTGGIAKDPYLVEKITEMVRFIAPVISYAGEFEMEAMAAGAIRVLRGEEEPKTYDGKPVWSGFVDERNCSAVLL
jgi:butyrate kinase